MKKIFVCFFLLLTFPSFALPTEDDLKEFRQEMNLCKQLLNKANAHPQDSSVSGTQIIDCYLDVANKISALYYPDYQYIFYDMVKHIKQDKYWDQEGTYPIQTKLSRMMPFLPKQLHTFKKIEQGLTQKNTPFLNPIFSAPLEPHSRHSEKTVLTDKNIIHSVLGRKTTYTCRLLENRLLHLKYICNSHHYKSADGKIDEQYNDITIHTFMPFWINEWAVKRSPLLTDKMPETQLLIREEAKSLYGSFIYDATYLIKVPFDLSSLQHNTQKK